MKILILLLFGALITLGILTLISWKVKNPQTAQSIIIHAMQKSVNMNKHQGELPPFEFCYHGVDYSIITEYYFTV